ARSNSKPLCEFSLAGLWRTTATSERNPVYYNFSPEGWVVLLGYSPDALPQEFEMLASVNYKLDDPRNPKVIEFSTPRGTESFVQGLTMMKILSFSQDSFTTKSIGSDEEIRWDREQTHRYFLTFAARSAVSQPQEGPAFVMWTSMDGRETNVDALGT